ncbi:tetratricopeptide repeat protein [Alteromonas gracilis]|uniref:tetratricopeptide repeat protein n=1 Tax=Alteromonas gracilis TaxID=1479524 RepID=UPI00373612D5
MLKNNIRIAAALALLTCVGCSPKAQQDYIQETKTALENGQTREAEILIKQAMSEKPTSSLRLLLTEVYLLNGNIIGATQQLEKVDIETLTPPEQSKAESLNAQLAILSFDSNYQRLLDSETNCQACRLAEAWSSVASSNSVDLQKIESDTVAYKVFEAFDNKTLSSLDISSLIDSSTSDIELLVMGDLLRRSNNLDGMITVYDAYKKNNPNVLNINLPLAQAMLIKDDFKRAKELVNPVLAKFAKNPMANYLNSLILLSENKQDEAYNAISLADTYGIDMPSVSLTKGLLEFNSQNYESALSSFEKATNMAPDNELANTMLVATKVKLGITDDALETLATQESFSELDVSTIGQLIGTESHAREWVTLQSKLAQSESPRARVLSGLIELAREGSSETLSKPGDTSDSTYNLIQVAMMMNKAQFDDALNYVNKWLERTNDKVKVMNYKAAILIAKGDRDSAKSVYQESLELLPTNRAAHMFMAQSAAKNKDYESALNSLDKILENNLNDIVVLKLYLAFQKLSKSEKYESKLHSYIDDAISEFDDNVLFKLMKAGIFATQGANELAQRVLNTVDAEKAKLINQYWELQFYLASRSNNANQARDIVKAWNKQFPDSTRPNVAFATYLENAGQLKEAISVLEQVPHSLDRPKESLALDSKLVSLYIHQGNLSKAKYKIGQLEKKSNLPPGLLDYLNGTYAVKQNNLDEAASLLTKAYSESSNSHTLKLLHALNLRRGNVDNGILKAHLEQYPNDLSIKALLAESLIGQDNAQSIALFEEIVSQTSGNTDVLNNYAWVLHLEGKNDKAFEIAKRVVELNASNQDYLDTLFRILTSSKRYNEITAFSNNASSDTNTLLLANAHMHLDEQAQAQKALASVEKSSLSEEDLSLYERVSKDVKN